MAQMLSKSTKNRLNILPDVLRKMDVYLRADFESHCSTDVTFNNDEQLRSWVCDGTMHHNLMLDVDSSPSRCRLTHIVCTIGPASREVEMLVKLMKAGMNICRLNFSHGSYEYHEKTVKNIHEAAAQMPPGYVVATALDTKGPEIRTGLLQGGASADVKLETGGKITITINDEFKEKCSAETLWVDYKDIVNSLDVDGIIYIDDGLISLKVTKKTSDSLICHIINGGMLGSKKGVNLPNVHVDLPAVSDKDKEDLLFGVKNNVDMVFASFIQNAAGIKEIRQILGDKGAHIKILAKIESFEGIRNFAEIINECDGAMVARGDMGIEIPPEKVFIAQKMMISACNRCCKPVICATQMLESMTYKPRATRAESNDVANAVLDGADCVMLSGESAKGSYPEEAVRHMAAVCLESESCYQSLPLFKELKSLQPIDRKFSRTLAISAASASFHHGAAAIIVLASNVSTIHYISNFRPRCPIIMVTRELSLAKQSLLFRGVVPHIITSAPLPVWDDDMSMRFDQGIDMGVKNGFIKDQDALIMVMALTGEQGKNCSSVQTHIYKV